MASGRTKALLAGGALVVALVTFVVARKARHMRRPALPVATAAREGGVLPRAARAVETTGAGPLATAAAEGVLPPRRASMRLPSGERSYVVVEPARPSAGLPLVLVFHGDHGEAWGFHAAFPFERASGANAVVVYPDGLGRTWDLDPASRDLAFVDALVEERRPSAVFAVGYSSGAFFVNLLACARSSVVKGIAANAGGAPNGTTTWPNGFARCEGQGPVPSIALHGRRDINVTLDSGFFAATYWAYVNGCDTAQLETTGYPECTAFRACRSGKPSVWCEIPKLGHWVWDRSAEVAWEMFRAQL